MVADVKKITDPIEIIPSVVPKPKTSQTLVKQYLLLYEPYIADGFSRLKREIDCFLSSEQKIRLQFMWIIQPH